MASRATTAKRTLTLEPSGLLPDRRPVATGTFTRYPALVSTLPPLVKRQRRLAARIAAVAEAEKDEKALRGEIDALLVAAGLAKSEVVTCDGYDVRHNEKAGSSSLDETKLTEQLVAGGVDRAFIAQVIVDSTETGKPSLFATVNPTKGAKVQRPEQLQMVKATSRKRG